MHYTSWDRTDRDNPVLLAEQGPEVLATFHQQGETPYAQVGQQRWELVHDSKQGASMTAPDGRLFIMSGRLNRVKRLEARLDGTTYVFINEAGSDWVIDDVNGNKVAQFSGKNSGVRKAILEFEGQATLPEPEIVALSWFARLLLEEKVGSSAIAIIGTLVLASIVAVVTFLT